MDRDKVVPISNIPGSDRSEVRNAKLIETTSIRTELLSPSLSLAPFSGDSISPSTQLILSVDDRELSLVVLEAVLDSERALRHVTAAIVNDKPGSYARFTVDDIRGIVAATIRTNIATYRLISRSERGEQLVYRLDAGDSVNRYSMLGKRGTSVGVVEKRHTQAEILADLMPKTVTIAQNDFTVRLIGGNLGVLQEPETVTGVDLQALLARMAPLTNALGTETLRITYLTPRRKDALPAQRELRFRQVLDGIEVNRPNSIVVDEAGRIVSMTTSIVSQDQTRDRPLLDEMGAKKMRLTPC